MALCPICGEDTISLICHQEQQGESPWTGWITVADDHEQECDCVLTDDQLDEVLDKAECREPSDPY